MGKTILMNMEHMIDGKQYVHTMSGKCVTDMQTSVAHRDMCDWCGIGGSRPGRRSPTRSAS